MASFTRSQLYQHKRNDDRKAVAEAPRLGLTRTLEITSPLVALRHLRGHLRLGRQAHTRAHAQMHTDPHAALTSCRG